MNTEEHNADEFAVVRDALKQIKGIKTYWDYGPVWENWEEKITPAIVEKMLAVIDVKAKASK